MQPEEAQVTTTKHRGTISYCVLLIVVRLERLSLLPSSMALDLSSILQRRSMSFGQVICWVKAMILIMAKTPFL